ncbi:MAG TPA: GMC family oxidoreductase N-terminal domain-containing protein, partial [Burkholderiales bacterium]|nr:GMC family oxidoreductase N-terminal domain-containing protein [Burkholderiales bacterium]
MSEDTFDYVIVGAGSAGCVLANRLSASGKHTVLLLEAGGSDRHLWITVPLGIGKIRTDERFHWKFHTAPEPHMQQQRLYWPRGRVIGGSSSVNGMIFNRGQPADYDGWRDLGNTGWGFDDLLPYFKRLEHFPGGDPVWRGTDGPIHVTDLASDPDPLSEAFIDASAQAGYARVRDYNAGENDEGTGYLQLNILNGRRVSTATAYLRPALKRSNLHILQHALVHRVLFVGKRARGVEYERTGTRQVANARREVILCAGTIQSPQLLELSGIGNEQLLRCIGIPVVNHLPGVGENLQDHLQVRMVFECNKPLTLNAVLANPLRQWLMGLQYITLRKGLMTTPSAKAFTNVKADPEASRADVKIQLYMISGDRGQYSGSDLVIDHYWGFSLGHNQMRPRSRGSIHINSSDPHRAPEIRANYLDDPFDRRTNIRALRVMRTIAAQPALARYIVRERRPGTEILNDEEILDYCRSVGHTSYHPAGTCKMGVDERAVVDPLLRVRGVERLRVVDASVMPVLTSCN